jgi:hypothetical protein
MSLALCEKVQAFSLHGLFAAFLKHGGLLSPWRVDVTCLAR